METPTGQALVVTQGRTMHWRGMACMDRDTSEHVLMLCFWAGDLHSKNGGFSWTSVPPG